MTLFLNLKRDIMSYELVNIEVKKRNKKKKEGNTSYLKHIQMQSIATITAVISKHGLFSFGASYTMLSST